MDFNNNNNHLFKPIIIIIQHKIRIPKEEQTLTRTKIWQVLECFKNLNLKWIDWEKRIHSLDIKKIWGKEILKMLCLKIILCMEN